MGAAAQTQGSKQCKKKRGKKDLMLAQMTTGKHKKRRAETMARRRDRHDAHLMAWALRNGVVAGCPASARQQVREHRANKRA